MREILMALGDLKNHQVKDIRLFLQSKREQEFEQICLTRQIRFISKSKEEYVKKYTINRRTIHNHLDYLIDKKLVEHIGKKYTLSEVVIKGTRYWARAFGDAVLNMLMRTYWPQILKLEQNVDELIKIFGIYVNALNTLHKSLNIPSFLIYLDGCYCCYGCYGCYGCYVINLGILIIRLLTCLRTQKKSLLQLG